MDYAILFALGFGAAWGIQQFRLNGAMSALAKAQAELSRLTDRDAKGRFKV